MNDQNLSRSYYAVITSTVLYSKDLTARQKLIYAMISNLSKEKGYSWATNAYFADAMGCDERTIQRDLKALEDGEFVVRKIYRNKDNSVKYRALYLTDRLVTRITEPDGEFVVEPGDENDTIITNTLITNNNTSKSDSIVAKIAALKLKDLFNAEHGTQTRIVSDKTIRQLKALIEAGYTVENVIEASKELKKEKWLAERNFKELNIEFITRPDKMEKYYNQFSGGAKKAVSGANEYVENYLKELKERNEQGNS
jgi:DNA-binding HxlR family transcriptional regulator